MKEQDIQRQILDYLRLKKIWCRKISTIGIRKENGSYIPSQSKGMSDIIGILPGGRFLAIEVKKPKGILSPAQKEFLDSVKAEGGLAIVAYSLDNIIEANL